MFNGLNEKRYFSGRNLRLESPTGIKAKGYLYSKYSKSA